MSLKEKASKINFSLLNSTPASSSHEDEPHRNKTAPGVMMAFANERRSALTQENDELKAQVADFEKTNEALKSVTQELKKWDGSSVTKKLDPKDIIPSKWANRHELSFSNQEFDDLRLSIDHAKGNTLPIKVRQIQNSNPAQYEIVFGHRRHRACLELGYPVLAMIEDVSDRQLFIEMDRENRNKADLRPYEQGLMYQRALDTGLYPSIRMLASDAGISLSSASLTLRLVKFPKVILDAFPSCLNIQFRWISKISDALDANSDHVINMAESIIKERRNGVVYGEKDVFAKLVSQENAVDSQPSIHCKEVVIDGKTIATLKSKNNKYSIEFAKDALSEKQVQKLESLIATVLF